jgi:hypothetical protein
VTKHEREFEQNWQKQQLKSQAIKRDFNKQLLAGSPLRQARRNLIQMEKQAKRNGAGGSPI